RQSRAQRGLLAASAVHPSNTPPRRELRCFLVAPIWRPQSPVRFGSVGSHRLVRRLPDPGARDLRRGVDGVHGAWPRRVTVAERNRTGGRRTMKSRRVLLYALVGSVILNAFLLGVI